MLRSSARPLLSLNLSLTLSIVAGYGQSRLLLHAAAYWLLDALRGKLLAAGVERTQLDSLRLSLIKIGGRVRQLLTRLKLHLASGHPGRRLWRALGHDSP